MADEQEVEEGQEEGEEVEEEEEEEKDEVRKGGLRGGGGENDRDGWMGGEQEGEGDAGRRWWGIISPRGGGGMGEERNRTGK